jgi:hypothetical protein
MLGILVRVIDHQGLGRGQNPGPEPGRIVQGLLS